MEELKLFVEEFIAKYPEHKGEVLDLFDICKDEIEQGASMQQEIESCMWHIEEIIN